MHFLFSSAELFVLGFETYFLCTLLSHVSGSTQLFVSKILFLSRQSLFPFFLCNFFSCIMSLLILLFFIFFLFRFTHSSSCCLCIVFENLLFYHSNDNTITIGGSFYCVEWEREYNKSVVGISPSLCQCVLFAVL
eukprot:GCRY01005314.1.p1 GENE.GCRY01005314.1~~GCRY01005314.1.p1  ORF type:complete len:135 (-),score=4.25 GCRY01005314.1:50-454(-)